MGLEWETLFYWHRRAVEIKYGKEVPENDNGKVDDESFEKQKERLNRKLQEIENRKQGTISG